MKLKKVVGWLLTACLLMCCILAIGCSGGGCAAKTVKITFDAQGGTFAAGETASVEVAAGSKLREPEVSKENGILLGWYSDSEFTEEWNFRQDSVQEDMTLYALWRIQYKVTFYSGEEVVNIQRVNEGGKATFPGLGPTLVQGYRFRTWYTDPALTAGTEYNFDTVLTDSISLYGDPELITGWDFADGEQHWYLRVSPERDQESGAVIPFSDESALVEESDSLRLSYDVTGARDVGVRADALRLPTDEYPTLEITYKCLGDPQMIRIYFSTDEPMYSQFGASTMWSASDVLVRNMNEGEDWKTLRIDMGALESWKGNLKNLRIDFPFRTAAEGQRNQQVIILKEIQFTREKLPGVEITRDDEDRVIGASWDFSRGALMNWRTRSEVSTSQNSVELLEDGIVISFKGNTGVSHAGFENVTLNIPLSHLKTLRFRYKALGAPLGIRVFLKTAEKPEWQGGAIVGGLVTHMSDTDEWEWFALDLSRYLDITSGDKNAEIVPEGTLTTLRIDFYTAEQGTDHTVLLSEIRLDNEEVGETSVLAGEIVEQFLPRTTGGANPQPLGELSPDSATGAAKFVSDRDDAGIERKTMSWALADRYPTVKIVYKDLGEVKLDRIVIYWLTGDMTAWDSSTGFMDSNNAGMQAHIKRTTDADGWTTLLFHAAYQETWSGVLKKLRIDFRGQATGRSVLIREISLVEKPFDFETFDIEWFDGDTPITGDLYRTSYSSGDRSYKLPDAPDKPGYEFVGWYSAAEGGEKVTGIPAGSVGNKQFYARYDAIRYELNYIENGSAVTDLPQDAPLSYTVESNILLPQISRPGWQTDGWFTKDGSDGDWGEQVAEIQKGTTGNRTFYLKMTRLSFTITYHTNCAAEIPAQTGLHYGDSITEPAPPENGTQIFGGWFEDEDFITPFAFGTMPARNVELYAKWVAEPVYAIVYRDGEREMEELLPKGYVSSEGATLPTTAVKVGWSFEGWFTRDGSADGDWGESVREISVGSTGDRTFYAKFKINSYILTLNPNGGVLEGSSEMRFDYDAALSGLPSPLRTGYLFAGWFADETLSKPLPDSMPAGDFTAYAEWTPIDYQLLFHFDGFETEGVLPSKYTVEDAEILLPEVLPTENRNFRGWFTKDGTQGDWGVCIRKIAAGSTDDLELWARVETGYEWSSASANLNFISRRAATDVKEELGESVKFTLKSADGGVSIGNLNLSLKSVSGIRLRYRLTGTATRFELFVQTDKTNLSKVGGDIKSSVALTTGVWTETVLPLGSYSDTDILKALRIDLDGSSTERTFEISEIELVETGAKLSAGTLLVGGEETALFDSRNLDGSSSALTKTEEGWVLSAEGSANSTRARLVLFGPFQVSETANILKIRFRILEDSATSITNLKLIYTTDWASADWRNNSWKNVTTSVGNESELSISVNDETWEEGTELPFILLDFNSTAKNSSWSILITEISIGAAA